MVYTHSLRLVIISHMVNNVSTDSAKYRILHTLHGMNTCTICCSSNSVMCRRTFIDIRALTSHESLRGNLIWDDCILYIVCYERITHAQLALASSSIYDFAHLSALHFLSTQIESRETSHISRLSQSESTMMLPYRYRAELSQSSDLNRELPQNVRKLAMFWSCSYVIITSCAIRCVYYISIL